MPVRVPLVLSLILGASVSVWPPAAAAPFQLPHCQLVNQTVSLEKEECPMCYPLVTTTCSGYCMTKDPVIMTRYRKVYQHVCTYRAVEYRTFQLHGCPPGVDPIVTYPVALSCYCSRCVLETTDCTYESLEPDICINDITY